MISGICFEIIHQKMGWREERLTKCCPLLKLGERNMGLILQFLYSRVCLKMSIITSFKTLL